MTVRMNHRSVRISGTCALFLAVLIAALPVRSADPTAARQERILTDIKYLASDELEGRGVGTKGLDLAADYIVQQFQKVGLKPASPNETYLQEFEMRSGSKLGEPNRLVLSGPGGRSLELAVHKDFIPLVFSGSGRFQAPLVFAGYGISASEFAYDDYAELDVKGKVVLVMRREPRQSDRPDPHAPFQGNTDTQHAALYQKATNAARRGAVAVLYVTEPYSLKTQPDKLLDFGYGAGPPSARIPLLHITRAMADSLLRDTLGQDLPALEAKIDADLKPQTVAIEGWTCSGEVTLLQQTAQVKNVLGVLDGSGPRAEETIVIGAHYDHLGYGGPGSLAPASREIHNGADDNASGTAGLIELARRLAQRPDPLPRRVLFAAFTAEESGLIGSAHYVQNPAIPITQTVAMLNFDMIGRLRDHKLIIYGTGTAKEFMPLLESLNEERGFKISPVASGFGPSDQTSFYRFKVPVLHFFTDNHPDYHKPSDDWEKVSVEGVDRVVDLVEAFTVAVANAEIRPTYQETAMPLARGGPGGERAYLGSIPAFGSETDGALLDGVAPGGPADKAGLRGGDIIVRVGDKEVHSLEDLEGALRIYKPGDQVKITVQRGFLHVTYPVTLSRRQQ